MTDKIEGLKEFSKQLKKYILEAGMAEANRKKASGDQKMTPRQRLLMHYNSQEIKSNGDHEN
jgi:hypothetical protein